MLLLLLAEELQGLWGQRESHEASLCWNHMSEREALTRAPTLLL